MGARSDPVTQNKNHMAERGTGRGPVSCWDHSQKPSLTRNTAAVGRLALEGRIRMKRERKRSEGSRNHLINGCLAVKSAAKFTSLAAVATENKNKIFHTLPWRQEYPSLRPAKGFRPPPKTPSCLRSVISAGFNETFKCCFNTTVRHQLVMVPSNPGPLEDTFGTNWGHKDRKRHLFLGNEPTQACITPDLGFKGIIPAAPVAC